MAVELKYNNPLTLEAGTGITGSVNGENFTTRRIEGLVDENVVINIGQAVETTSNTTFNDVTSSNVVKVGDDSLFLGDGFISSSNSVVAHTGSVVVTGSFNFNGVNITEISNDGGLADASQNALVTEYAVKTYADNISANVAAEQTYLRII